MGRDFKEIFIRCFKRLNIAFNQVTSFELYHAKVVVLLTRLNIQSFEIEKLLAGDDITKQRVASKTINAFHSPLATLGSRKTNAFERRTFAFHKRFRVYKQN